VSHVLAVDLGTGTAKVALVARDGTVAGWAARPIATRQLPGGGAEQDPAEWWAAVCGSAREALASGRLGPADVVAVRCTTQWAVTVAVDNSGRELAPALSWLDSRGGPHVRRIAGGRIGGYNAIRLRRWIRLTGGAPVLGGVDGLGHALFLKHERPEVYAAADKLLEPADYLNLRMTGVAAASFGTIFPYWLTDNRDPRRIDYDATLLATAGIDRAKLPDLVAMDAVVGGLLDEPARELGLAPKTPVLAGTTDLESATVGAGAVAAGQGYFSVGTTSWLSCHVPAKRTDLRHMLGTMPAALPGRYVVVAEQGLAGRCLEWLKDTLIDEPYEELERRAASVPAGSDGLIFTPWLGGVSVPTEDFATRSAFFNQSWRTTRSHYVRAVMEGVAFNLRWLRPHVERFARTRFAELRFIGGAGQSDTWGQILADVLGVPILRVAEPRLANAVGCGLLAFAALGEIAEHELSARVPIGRVFEPDPAHAAVYDRSFEAFLALYKANRPIHRRLNRGAGPR
jgi:xylulokinase